MEESFVQEAPAPACEQVLLAPARKVKDVGWCGFGLRQVAPNLRHGSILRFSPICNPRLLSPRMVVFYITSNLQQSWGAEVSKRERDYRKE